MSFGRSVIGTCTQFTGKEMSGIDTGMILRRVLLFDRFIIQSFRLQEIAHFVQAFGIDGTCALLDSGAVQLMVSFVSPTNTGQATVIEERARKGALPLGSYELSWLLGSREQRLSQSFSNLDRIPGKKRAFQRLKRSV